MNRDDRLIAYMQDRMEPSQRATFEADLAEDRNLKAELTVMQAAKKAMAATQKSQNASDGWSKLHHEIYAPANQNRVPWLTLAQAAGVAVIAVGLWEFVASRWIAPETGGQEFTTASENALGSTLQVVLVPTASLSDITALLQESHGTIIDGPGALGVYRIGFQNEEDRDLAHKAFEANEGLVATVLFE